MAIRNERTTSNNASPQNWRINCGLSAPITFRTPTSSARVVERPIDNVTKFIQAINNIKIPIVPKT